MIGCVFTNLMMNIFFFKSRYLTEMRWYNPKTEVNFSLQKAK